MEYDLDTCHQIIDSMTDFKPVHLQNEALTRILGLLEETSIQSEDQKYIKASAIIEKQNAYVPTYKKVNRNVTAADSLEVKRNKAYQEFNRLDRKNAVSVATEMKKYVGNHDISYIFFDALFSLIDDNLERYHLWEYWIKLLPELNKGNAEFEKDIVNDTIQRFESLQKSKENVVKYKIIGCWLSCLLSVNFITPEKYIQLLHDIIKSDHLKTHEIVSVIYSSLSISGRRIDDKKNPIPKCWFLFNFLTMNKSECSSFLKCQITDLFDLRACDWNHALFQAKIEGSTKPTTTGKYRPPGSSSQESFKKSPSEKELSSKAEAEKEKKFYSQQEHWDEQFTKYSYHPDQYKPPWYSGSDNQTTMQVLLSLIIKKKGKEIENFFTFANIILTKIFKNNVEDFVSAAIKAKTGFRKIFFGKEEITIFNENHTRFYKLIANFLISNWSNLNNYVTTLFNIYLHINDLNTKDDIYSPIPSVFIGSIFEILETEDYLKPEKCVALLSNFPNKQDDFNNIVFNGQDSVKNKRDDFWPFIGQLAYDTDPSLVDTYLEKFNDKNIEQYSDYDRLLLFYNKCYKVINEGEKEQSIADSATFVTTGFSDDQKKDIVETSLNLLLKDESIDVQRKNQLKDSILKDYIGMEI